MSGTKADRTSPTEKDPGYAIYRSLARMDCSGSKARFRRARATVHGSPSSCSISRHASS
jgi:hypothetical protein